MFVVSTTFGKIETCPSCQQFCFALAPVCVSVHHCRKDVATAMTKPSDVSRVRRPSRVMISRAARHRHARKGCSCQKRSKTCGWCCSLYFLHVATSKLFVRAHRCLAASNVHTKRTIHKITEVIREWQTQMQTGDSANRV